MRRPMWCPSQAVGGAAGRTAALHARAPRGRPSRASRRVQSPGTGPAPQSSARASAQAAAGRREASGGTRGARYAPLRSGPAGRAPCREPSPVAACASVAAPSSGEAAGRRGHLDGLARHEPLHLVHTCERDLPGATALLLRVVRAQQSRYAWRARRWEEGSGRRMAIGGLRRLGDTFDSRGDPCIGESAVVPGLNRIMAHARCGVCCLELCDDTR